MKRSVIFVLLAGAAAMVASIVVYSALKRREAEAMRARVDTIEIVVAARDLPLGTKLDASNTKLARWSKESVPPGAFMTSGGVMNAVVKDDMTENEPITQNKLFEGQKTAGVLPLLIPDGMRAMSVPVDEVSDIAGFVLPNTRVDVLVSVNEQEIKSFAKMVLQDVQVLAVAQEIQRGKDDPQVVKVVTLLVNPDQAEKLALASREGTLRLAMRGYDDRQIVQTSGVTLTSMLGMQTAAPVHVTSTKTFIPRTQHGVNVEIMRDGKDVKSIEFSNGGSGPIESESKSGPEVGKANSSMKVASAAAESADSSANEPAAPASHVNLTTGIAGSASYSPVPKTIDIP